MPDSAQVLQLLADALDSDRTPDEVCAAFPELLGEVRLRWEECRLFKGDIDSLLPPSDAACDLDPVLRQWGGGFKPNIPGYEIGSILGRGGMGVVYRARHIGLNRMIALKMLLSGIYASPIELARFLREARAVAGLKHPNLVQVYDVGEFEGRTFYTMELVDGATLAEKLNNMPQPSGDAANMLILLCNAVQTAHDGGIVHRDLKPSNILLTVDGNPKISDFGLARSVGGDDSFTVGNAGAGTPSYMAPEQVAGSKTAFGPPGDVYSLGVILYEMLTGRPPFRGESPAETRRQLLADEPLPPSRLNPRVPRDLETICLRCLQKEPSRRYECARLLADDLHRFQTHEPILARRSGFIDRSAKWIRRHPTATTAYVAAAILSLSVAGAALWLISARASTARAAEQDLLEAIRCQQHSDWPAATAALQRAGLRLSGGGRADLLDRLKTARENSALVVKLDAIRLTDAECINGDVNAKRRESSKAYADAFRDAGFIGDHDEPAAIARKLQASPISGELLTALDAWAFSADGVADARRMAIVRAVHTNPDGSTDDLLPLALGGDEAACNAFVAKGPVSARSLPILLATVNKFPVRNLDPIPILTKLQKEFPDDFWCNEFLGSALDNSGKQEESLRYLQSAVSLRPGVGIAYNNLGRALFNAKRYPEAIDLFKRAMEIDPTSPRVYANLALALAMVHQPEAAEKEALTAIRLDPDPVSHNTLAGVYELLGKHDEAIAESSRAVALAPTSTTIQDGLRVLLRRANRPDDALAAWRSAIQASPKDHEALDGYAEYCLYLGRAEEYERAREDLLQAFGDAQNLGVCERTGRACLLLPPSSPEQLQRATAAIDRAVAAASRSPALASPLLYYKFAKALAEYRAGHFDAALSLAVASAGVLQPGPQLVAAMAEHRLGREREAREYLAAATASRQWGPTTANGPDAREVWIYHLLRREAEALILPAK